MTMTPGKDTNEMPNVLEQKCIHTIRFLAVDAVQKANSGHPGMPMEAADIAYLLWSRVMNYDPHDPAWPNRDRFVLSAGHGSMLLYAILHLTGYDLSLEQIHNFRQWGSCTPGHPELHCAPGIETTSGPLGQGFATGVGMAMAGKYLANMFNRPDITLLDYHIFGLVSDGDMMEGVSSEAASLAGHLGLGNLIYVYLDNSITIEGSTDLAFSEDVFRRFESYDWHVQRMDGYDLPSVERAIESAKEEKAKPSLIIAKTHIAFGSPNKQDTADAHGSPLGSEEVALTKRNCGWPEEPAFHVPEDVLAYFRSAGDRGRHMREQWQRLFKDYSQKHPDLASQWKAMHDGPEPSLWASSLPTFQPDQGKVATRQASGKVLATIAPHLPGLIGGSADLAPSNNTYLKGFGEFKKDLGRNIHFGIREHAMAAVLNGLALSRALIPYGGTFLVFSDYMRPAIRLAAMMDLPVIYVFTHDSIGLGEDGPTHQPIEHLASLRAMPNLVVIRPADAQETVEAWQAALQRRQGPTALILTRQGLPILDRNRYAPASGLRQGAYILADPPGRDPQLILMGSGSEVHLLLSAYEILSQKSMAVRVVNMASWELFEAQPREYREQVLPSHIKARLAVEAASPFGWERYVGADGAILGITRFGASAPGNRLFQEFGFSTEHVVHKATTLVKP